MGAFGRRRHAGQSAFGWDNRQISAGCRISENIGLHRSGDSPRLEGNASRIRKDPGWRPEFHDLGIIIETAWTWHKTQK